MGKQMKRVSLPSLVQKYRFFTYSPFSTAQDLSNADLKGVTVESLAEAEKLCDVMIPRMQDTYAYLVRGNKMYYRRSSVAGTNMPFQGVGHILLADAVATFLLSHGQRGRVVDVAFSAMPAVVAIQGAINTDSVASAAITEDRCLKILASIRKPFALHDDAEIKEVYVPFVKDFLKKVTLSGDHSTSEYIAYLIAQRFVQLCFDFFDSLTSDDDGFKIRIEHDIRLPIPRAGDQDFGQKMCTIVRKYQEWHAYVSYLESMSLESKLAFSTSKKGDNVFVSISSQYYSDILKGILNALVKPLLALSSYMVKFDSRYTNLKQYLIHAQLLACVDASVQRPKNCLYALLSDDDIERLGNDVASRNIVQDDLSRLVEQERELSAPLAEDFEKILNALFYTAESPFSESFKLYKTYINGQEKLYRLDHKGRDCYTLSLGSYAGNSIESGLSAIDSSAVISGTVESELAPVVHTSNQTEFMGTPTSPGDSHTSRDGVVICIDDAELVLLRQERKRACESLNFGYDPLNGNVSIERDFTAYCIYPPAEGPDVVAFGGQRSRRDTNGPLYECRKVDLKDGKADVLDVILSIPARFVEATSQESLRDLHLKQIEVLGKRSQPTWETYECRILEHDESSFKLSWLLMSSDPDVRRIAARNERLVFVPFSTDPAVLFNRRRALQSQLAFPSQVRIPRYFTATFTLPRAFVSPMVLDVVDTRGSFRTNDCPDGNPRCKIVPSDDSTRVDVTFHLDSKTDVRTGDRRFVKSVQAGVKQDTYVVDLEYDNVSIKQKLAAHNTVFCFVGDQVLPWPFVFGIFDSSVFSSGFASVSDINSYLLDLIRTALFIRCCSISRQKKAKADGQGMKPVAFNATFVSTVSAQALLAEICDAVAILSRKFDLTKLRITGSSGFGFSHFGNLLRALTELKIDASVAITPDVLSNAGVTLESKGPAAASKNISDAAVFTLSEKAEELLAILDAFYTEVTGSNFETQFSSTPMMPVQFCDRHYGFFRRTSKWRIPMLKAPTVIDGVIIDAGVFQKDVAEFLSNYTASMINNLFVSGVTGCYPDSPSGVDDFDVFKGYLASDSNDSVAVSKKDSRPGQKGSTKKDSTAE